MRPLFYLFLLLLVSSCTTQKRKIQGNGMNPTVDTGDFVYVKKTNKDLTYGDLIYYKFYGIKLKGSQMIDYYTMGDDFLDDTFYEKLNAEHISRIVGIPGDTISIENNFCVINSIKNKYHLIEKIDKNKNLYEEEFPNDVSIKVYSDSINPDYVITNTQKVVVPPDYYYILCDNRSEGVDSRDIGFVSKNDIIGKVVKIEYKK